MRSHESNGRANNRSVSTIWLKIALVSLAALLSAALPQMLGAHAGAAPAAPQGFLFTVTTLDDDNDFVCDGTDCTLREAIQAANNTPTEDTIDFAVTGTISLASALPDISGSVTIEGPGAALLAVRRSDSAGNFRIFNVTTAGAVTFSGLTISNGDTFDIGGGILNFGIGTVNVINSTISGNTSDDGGGIHNNSTGTVNVTNSTISDNDGGRGLGGGIHNSSTGAVTVTDSTISGNTIFRGAGGGICNIAGTVTVTNSTVSGNTSLDGRGGGISNLTTGTVNVIGSMINGNEADQTGGGIDNGGIGAISVINTMVSGNEAAGGGGVGNDEGMVTFTNSTIIDNTSVFAAGGGIRNNTGIVDVVDTTISGNAADDGGGVVNRGSGIVNVTRSTINGNDGGRGIGGGILNNSTGTVNVTNSTISANSVFRGSGGGINNFSTGAVNVTNSTIAGNFGAESDGGGVFNSTTGTVSVKSSVIASNTGSPGPDVFGPFLSQGFNLIGKTDGSTGFITSTDLTGTTASPLNPKLETDDMGQPLLKDNGGPTQTIALLCESPAIDKGTSDSLTGILTTDQRGTGFSRTIDDPLFSNASSGDGTDIGAFEFDTLNCNHPPVAQCRNIQVSAGNNCQASITPEQIDNGSFDPDKGDSIATRTLDDSGPFGLGPHTVTLTVTDTHGASSSCTATVTVVDTTPPTVTCPATQIVPAAPGECQAVVYYLPPTVADNCPGAMLVGCVPPSGSTFQVGVTSVICIARDAANNTGTCEFELIVLDNQPPTITCPANVTALTEQSACPNPACQVVSYPPPVVSDNCAGVTAVCNPPAGSCFPTGVTTVTCTATDAAGNTAICSFTVTVFDVALQDDSNPGTILLWNSITGAYRFCCNGITFTGIGKSRVQGCIYTLEHNPADRRLLGRVDKAVRSGSGSIQAPAGTIRCTITDRNTMNDTNLTSCQ